MSEKIEVLVVEFKSTNDLVVEAKEYRKIGNFLEFSKTYGINIKDRFRSYFKWIDIRDFPKSEWCG